MLPPLTRSLPKAGEGGTGAAMVALAEEEAELSPPEPEVVTQ